MSIPFLSSSQPLTRAHNVHMQWWQMCWKYCHAQLPAAVSLMKLAAAMPQTLSEMQVGGFAALCSYSASPKACQASSTFRSRIPLCPYLQGDGRRTQGQSSHSRAEGHMVIWHPHEEETLIPDPSTALPCTHLQQWLSSAFPNRWIARYSTVGRHRSSCLLIIHCTLWNTTLAKEKICGCISAFWQSPLGLRWHAGCSSRYERSELCTSEVGQELAAVTGCLHTAPTSNLWRLGGCCEDV